MSNTRLPLAGSSGPNADSKPAEQQPVVVGELCMWVSGDGQCTQHPTDEQVHRHEEKALQERQAAISNSTGRHCPKLLTNTWMEQPSLYMYMGSALAVVASQSVNL